MSNLNDEKATSILGRHDRVLLRDHPLTTSPLRDRGFQGLTAVTKRGRMVKTVYIEAPSFMDAPLDWIALKAPPGA